MADVLTQAPLVAHVGPHVAARPRTSRLVPLSPKITASTIRSLPSRNKARLAETAHVEYIARRGFSFDGTSSAYSHSHHQLVSHIQDDENRHSDANSVSPTDAEGARRDDHVAMPTSLSDSSSIAYSHVNQDKQLPATPGDEESALPGHDSETTPRQSRYDDLADALTRDPPRLRSPTPPPVPPKSDHGPVSRIRTVSILEPSELSHDSMHEKAYYASDYTVSEPGHSSIPPVSTNVPNSGRVPRRKTFSSSRPARHSAGPFYGYPSRLSWADRASLPIYRQSFPADGHQTASGPTSMSAFSESPSYPSHLARRKLKKPRPMSTISSRPHGASTSSSSPSPGSSSTLNLLRAFSHKSAHAPHDSAQPSTSSSSPRNSINFFRLRRCTSDRGHYDSTTPSNSDGTTTRVNRPPVLSRQSENGSAQSHSHSSSTSHSTTFLSSSPSDHSTPATTPEASSPVSSPTFGPSASQCSPGAEGTGDTKNEDQISPPHGDGPRKLRKRRPSQPAPGTSEPSSSGTPDFPGLRRWRTQAGQASSPAPPTTQSVYLPPISPVSPFGLDIPKEYTSGRRLAFPPPPKRKRSTSALAQLAWTGLSSSELAALTSRLHIQRNSPEHSSQAGRGKQTQEAPLGSFDPYSEGLYARGGNPKLEDVSAMDEEEENETEGGSALGHAVSSSLSTMRRMVSTRIDTQAPPSPVTSKPRANSVYVNGSNPSPLNLRAPPHGRKSASFLENDPMAMRRWTLAMADVPDEVLVQELDKLRKGAVTRKARGKSHTPAQSDSGHTVESNYSVSPSSPWRPGVQFRLGSDSDSEDEGDIEEDEILEGFENEADEEEWKKARRALLCCRELVRTERSYQARLRELLNAQSSHPFFSLLLSYVPALLRASEALLVRLVDDPSAWGVSAAFIGCEEELEAAFVAWCGVVGNFYIDGEDKDKRGRKRRKSGDETNGVSVPIEPRGFSARSPSQPGLAGLAKPRAEHRRLSLFNANEGGMFTAALGTGLAFGLSSPPTLDWRGHGSTASVSKDHGPTGTLTRTLSTWKRKSMPSSLSNLPSSSMGAPPSPSSAHGHTKEKLLTLRDLAIQPTQRVMRYVLQYKDLLAHTPVASPSRGLVERALESAVRIAKKCDRAQGNSAFLR
ncbi:hypothetical protein DAEQUDRAFT_808867 [Daedalea quercina L-15889]|uniref:DH domain-containing protein n=1 Tax=Daedalea quercina L-15889 TaxID=1314783 RepID=A0A165T3Z7_9APHY|nr:hypothetical protein DAEQUDRAFT_808867 [Daedalea quercina L-15889]